MLCAPVFIFTSGSSALLGCPRCGLSIWLSLLAIFNTLFWVYVNFFGKNGQNTKRLHHFRMIQKWPLTVTRCAKHYNQSRAHDLHDAGAIPVRFMGLNPIGASEFFLGFICKLLHNCKDLFHFYSLSAVHSYDLKYHNFIHFTHFTISLINSSERASLRVRLRSIVHLL